MRVRAADIQAAMGTIGRLRPSRDELAISLSRVDLRSIALRGAHTRLSGSRFRYAKPRPVGAGWGMARAQRSDTTLTAADLRRAYLEHAHLPGSNLSRAALQEANLRHADPLSHADLRGTNLTGAVLDGTVLTGAHADNTIWAPPSTPKDATKPTSWKTATTTPHSRGHHGHRRA